MAKKRKQRDESITLAVRALKQHGVDFTGHPYRWDAEAKGAVGAAQALGLDRGAVVKTLVFEDEDRAALVALMDAEHDVGTKQLARALGKKRIVPCAPARAEALTGYRVGGISPFGTRRSLPVYLPPHLLARERVYVNGGKRGFLVGLVPAEIVRVLAAEVVAMAVARRG